MLAACLLVVVVAEAFALAEAAPLFGGVTIFFGGCSFLIRAVIVRGLRARLAEPLFPGGTGSGMMFPFQRASCNLRWR